MATRMQQRRGTEAQWTSADPILAAGEIGFESDSGQFKIGDGVNHWSDLSYFKNLEDLGGSFDDYIPLTQKGQANGVATLDADGQVPAAQLAKVIDAAPDALNTLNELAAALGDDADFAGNVTTILSGKAPKLSPALTGTPTSPTPTLTDSSTAIATTAFVKGQGYALDSDVTDSIDAIVSDVTAINTSIGTINDSIDSLNTSVNTSLPGDINAIDTRVGTLETTTTSHGSSITTLQGDLDTAESTLATTTSNFNAHDAKTTSVHGIADTAALATKTYADTAGTNAVASANTYTDSAITSKAPLASPALTGTPTAPTATAGTNSTQVATTAYADAAVAALVASAPSALNTLNELATALGNDASFSTTVTTSLGLKAPSADPTFTGTVALPAASSVTLNGTALSTTLANKADKTATISSQSGSYTILTGDVNAVVEYNSGSAGTFTIPADNAFWPVGQRLEVLQVSSGQLTIMGGSGVTVNGTPTTKTRTQWSGATIIKRAANTFVVVGDLASS